jgi:hypothetical protein
LRRPVIWPRSDSVLSLSVRREADNWLDRLGVFHREPTVRPRSESTGRNCSHHRLRLQATHGR